MANRGAEEPSLVELKNGHRLAGLRNSLGSIHQARSTDGGQKWSEPVSTGLRAPLAPSLVKRIPSRVDLLPVGNRNLRFRPAVLHSRSARRSIAPNTMTNVSHPRLSDTPASHLPFSPVIVAGDFVFVSGQASVDTQGQIVSDSFEGEFRRSVENLRRVLAAAGCTLADVIQTRNYVREASDVPRYNQLYREYFSDPFPTRTTITNCLPPTLKYEIEAVAVKQSARGQ